MEYCVWGSFPNNQKIHLRTSLLSRFIYNMWLMPARERREHRIFQALLQMIPGLEERLMEGSNEDVIHIAELVCGNRFDEFPS
jgi:hypothetical protein